MTHSLSQKKVCIVGLGYVGFPLAVSLARHIEVKGVDINVERVSSLKQGIDVTNEVSTKDIQSVSLFMTADMEECRDCNIYIVTVPTPVLDSCLPDLSLVERATRSVASVLSKGDIVVYESTVYPGVTEDICGALLEEETGLVCGEDFYLGYSPERINPGDKVHTVDKMTKVVAGQTEDVTECLKDLYGLMNNGNIFVAKNIKTAEASKVIENAQRDINIAFVNEIAIIFEKMGISVYDVLEAARTKWNFLPFEPGLVGGHCIGVDPYYLSYAAQNIGIEPHVILSGRQVNDGMASVVAGLIDRYAEKIVENNKKHALLLGMTFKENVPDIRNSKVIDLYHCLVKKGYTIDVYDPLADDKETRHEYDLDLIEAPQKGAYDLVVGAVSHQAFFDDDITLYVKKGGLFADVKGKWRHLATRGGFAYWSL